MGLFVVAVITGGCFLLLQLYNGVPGVAYRTAYVSVPTVGNLINHDAVRIGGVRVGQVLNLDIGSDGRPRVELQLDPGTRLPADTSVGIRANGLLGARYVALTPGSSKLLLPDGGTIRGGPNSYTYGLPEAVEVFDKQTRGGMHTTIGAFGTGFAGNGAALNGALKDLGTSPGEFDALARAILSREGAAARLFPSLDSMMTRLASVRSYSRPFMQAAGDAVQPFVTERQATRATIAAVPGALSAADDGLRRGLRLLSSVYSLSTAAEQTLPRAPTGLTQLAALLQDAQAPLRRAERTVSRLLVPATTSATAALLATRPVLPRVKAGLDTARPTLSVVGRYACDVINTGAVLRSMTGFAQTGSGPLGPAMAFRLIAAPLAGAQVAGVKDITGFVSRSAYEAPCRYLSKQYPQNVPTQNVPALASRPAGR